MPVTIETISTASGFRDKWSGMHFNSECLIPVAQTLRSNIDRLNLFATLPTSLMGFGAHLQSEWTEAARLATGNTSFRPGDVDNPDVLVHMKRLVGNARWCDDDLLERTKTITKNIASIDEDASSERSFVDDGLEIFLAAQVLLSWTVFEVAAGDAIIAAANACTDSLGKALAKSVVAEPDQSKSVSFWMLEKHAFDLRGKLGDIFAVKLLKTRSLEDLSVAYSVAFGKQSVGNEILGASELRALSLTRNVLAHKGGVADEKFCKAIATTGFFQSARPGIPIVIEPTEASRFTELAIASSVKLLEFVDVWIKENGRPKVAAEHD